MPPPQPTIVQTTQPGGAVELHGSAPMGNQWLRDQQLLAGATDSVLLLAAAAQSGLYQVQVTSAAGCAADTSVAVRVQVVLGRAPELGAGAVFRRYPNPAHGAVQISRPAGAAWAELFDATGRLVRAARPARADADEFTLLLTGIAPGFYTVRTGWWWSSRRYVGRPRWPDGERIPLRRATCRPGRGGGAGGGRCVVPGGAAAR